MPGQEETVTVQLPSGEEVDVIVPSGMSDQQVNDLLRKQQPDLFKPAPQEQQLPKETPPQPSAASRLWTGIKNSFNHGPSYFESNKDMENYLNSKFDPKHPWATNPLVPGTEVYKDIRNGDIAGGLGRIGGTAAQILPMLFGGAGEEPAEPGLPQMKPPTKPSEVLGQAWSGERTGLPYQPNPHYAPAPVAEPLPPRTGPLLLKGEVMPELGSVDNPGLFSKIPLRVPASVLREEAAASRIPAYRDATRENTEFAGEEQAAPTVIPHEPVRPKPGIARNLRSSSGPTEFGAPSRGGGVWNRYTTGPGPITIKEGTTAKPVNLQENPSALVKSPAGWQANDAQIQSMRPGAQRAGMYSAKYGKIGRSPNYEDDIMKNFGEQ